MDGTPRISLALSIHNHQPIGNFGWVLESVFDQAYRPLIELLDRHPRVRLSLHYSGPLLQWLQAERPAVRRFGQVVAGWRAARGRADRWRLVRTGSRVVAGARPRGAAHAHGPRADADDGSSIPRGAAGWRSASGNRRCRRRSSTRGTPGRSSMTRTFARRRSRTRSTGRRTRPTTRGAASTCSERSRGCAT